MEEIAEALTKKAAEAGDKASKKAEIEEEKRKKELVCYFLNLLRTRTLLGGL